MCKKSIALPDSVEYDIHIIESELNRVHDEVISNCDAVHLACLHTKLDANFAAFEKCWSVIAGSCVDYVPDDACDHIESLFFKNLRVDSRLGVSLAPEAQLELVRHYTDNVKSFIALCDTSHLRCKLYTRFKLYKKVYNEFKSTSSVSLFVRHTKKTVQFCELYMGITAKLNNSVISFYKLDVDRAYMKYDGYNEGTLYVPGELGTLKVAHFVRTDDVFVNDYTCSFQPKGADEYPLSFSTKWGYAEGTDASSYGIVDFTDSELKSWGCSGYMTYSKLIFLLAYGPIAASLVSSSSALFNIDHRNNRKSDNSLFNLDVLTSGSNSSKGSKNDDFQATFTMFFTPTFLS